MIVQRFRTVIILAGKTATGFAVPVEVVEALGKGKKPPVRVTVGAHTYRSTVAVYGGEFMIPLSAENRVAAGVEAGEEVEVALELDTEPRTVEVPSALAAALAESPAARSAFDALSYSRQRAHVLQVESAKTEETRARRIAKIIAELAPSGGEA
ncbi:YdeI/OmpD-associated family protein [Microbacterium sp. No. 7]|uniref:YdeI/OmpD-associated family protein n=1 Tax=Microbacterium sp. No. 7 TaxID=1714373 RepID=UPI0006D19ACF|nr:YdeI/OmpD-associated family protein [Microbacterium sp. No. 7]ALJ18618.1 hypothetical protein AOA12_01290 [Microbacterium sp. No. 7]